MSVHWSSEVMKWEHRDLHATAMSVDYSGNNVLLAGRRWLAVKQIQQMSMNDDGGDIINKYPRHSKYDAAGAEWCQTYDGQKLCAIASNQRVDVYEWRNNNDLSCIASLRGHTRVVSDTHFHRQDHNLIATCSIDTFTHLWDLRDSRKPSLSLCAVAGVSQVQWNKVSPHLVATAHDGDIKIWDYRKHSAPIHYISAHLCKIHGVDWSPHHEYQIVTSSHDGSIKYFDINNARRPENIIMTNFPVWRAIYTPFGSGLLTIGVGWGGLPRAEQSGVIGIWVGGTLTHRLVGHTDTVQTMVWRPNTLPADYQLVTWGRDQTLRIWSMHPSLLKMCNHYLPDDTDVGDENQSDGTNSTSLRVSMNDISIKDKGGDGIKMNKLSHKSTSPAVVDEEFSSIKDIPNIVLTDTNMETRTCQLHIGKNGFNANFQVMFQKNVPEKTIPKFSWLLGTNIDSNTTIKILQNVNSIAYRNKKEGQKFLMQCVKYLATAVEEIPVKSSDDSDSMKSSQRSQSECENAGDSCIPFPRTCGAKWCGVSNLVVFNRSSNVRRMSLKHDTGTPRSMSSLSAIPGFFGAGYSSPHATTTPSPTNAAAFPQLVHRHPSNSITTFYFQDRWKAQSRRTGSVRSRSSLPGLLTPRVVLYEAADLFPIKRSLAEKYLIRADDPIMMCERNAEIARAEERGGLEQAWRLAALVAGALSAPGRDVCASSEESAGWEGHPLGRSLLHTLVSHYAKSADLQMAAMLACAFAVLNGPSESNSPSSVNISSRSTNVSPSNTVTHYSEIVADGWTIPIVHSSAFCECESGFPLPSAEGVGSSERPPPVLDAATLHQFHCMKRAYADVLHRWQLLLRRTEVMKLVGAEAQAGLCAAQGPALSAACACCGAAGGAGAGRGCAACGRAALRCCVCARSVRGLATACAFCGHLAHTAHFEQWFKENTTCPAGCGCKCLIDSTSTWKASKYI